MEHANKNTYFRDIHFSLIGLGIFYAQKMMLFGKISNYVLEIRFRNGTFFN